MENTNIVVFANAFMKQKSRLEPNEARVFNLVLGKINPKNGLNAGTELKFTIQEYKELYPWRKREADRDCRIGAVSLKRRRVNAEWEQCDGETNWFSVVKHEKGTSTYHVCISPPLVSVLTDLKGKFTQVKQKHVSRLTGIYAVRLYELLKSEGYKKSPEITVEQLREYLGCESTYLETSAFNTKVLGRAKREIERLTDMRFNYSKIYNGKCLQSYRFEIAKQKPQRPGAKNTEGKKLFGNGWISQAEYKRVFGYAIASKLPTITKEQQQKALESFRRQLNLPGTGG